MNHSKIFDFPKKEKNIKELSIKTAIIVPSTEFDKKITKAKFKKRIAETRRFLTKTFGGSTQLNGVGAWYSSPGKEIDEDIVVVESFTTKPIYNKHDLQLQRFVKKKIKEWKQEAISVEYKNELFIVS